MPAWTVDGNGSYIPENNRIQYSGSHFEPTGEKDDGRPANYVKVGGKYQQSQNAVNANLHPDEEIVIIGYSAGSSSSIMYARSRIENGQPVSELVLLVPDFTGAKEPGSESTDGFEDWEDDIDYLIVNGVDVTVVDDGIRDNGSQNYERPKCTKCSVAPGEFTYYDELLIHWNPADRTFPNWGTNSSPKLRNEVLGLK
ncbi:MAG TPA: hypothetical protein PK299_06450 [Anaerolineales bacterium]|nr:hypothetical protein [Anaerolineales bacterium]